MPWLEWPYSSSGDPPLRRATACRSKYSICPFMLRSSTAAHFSSSFQSPGGRRSRNGLRSSATN
jgi:hypothetical protein